MKYIILLVVFGVLQNISAQSVDTDTITPIKKEKSGKDIIDRLLNNPNSVKQKDTTIKDITGTAFGAGSMASIPEEFSEPSIEENWDPNSMTREDMERRAKIYYRNKYLNYGYIGIGICALIGAFLFIRKIMK